MENNAEELIRRSQRGDTDAFQKLAQSYKSRIFSLALRMLGNPTDAEDAAEESVIKLYYSMKKFRGQSSFSTWVYAVTRNTCLDIIRKNVKTRSDIDIEEVEYFVSSHEGDPHEATERGQKVAFLKKTINSLPEENRKTLILREMDGYSYEEIAELLNISVGTVKSRISRAKERIRTEFEKAGLI